MVTSKVQLVPPFLIKCIWPVGIVSGGTGAFLWAVHEIAINHAALCPCQIEKEVADTLSLLAFITNEYRATGVPLSET